MNRIPSLILPIITPLPDYISTLSATSSASSAPLKLQPYRLRSRKRTRHKLPSDEFSDDDNVKDNNDNNNNNDLIKLINEENLTAIHLLIQHLIKTKKVIRN